MGSTKSIEFTRQQNKLASLGKALGHPARIAILQLLANKATCQCGDIVEELPLSQSTVSQHLKELKAAGLIKGEIDGVRVCYCIDQVAWTEAQQIIGQLFNSYRKQASCC